MTFSLWLLSASVYTLLVLRLCKGQDMNVWITCTSIVSHINVCFSCTVTIIWHPQIEEVVVVDYQNNTKCRKYTVLYLRNIWWSVKYFRLFSKTWIFAVSQTYLASWCYQSFYLPTDAQAKCFKRILKFTLKQLQHVSVQSPSSGSVLFKLAKVTVVKIIN